VIEIVESGIFCDEGCFFGACDAVGDEMCSESRRFDRKNIIYKLIEVQEVTNEN
jgi:hypothetical protein